MYYLFLLFRLLRNSNGNVLNIKLNYVKCKIQISSGKAVSDQLTLAITMNYSRGFYHEIKTYLQVKIKLALRLSLYTKLFESI